jgi:tetratricopeptide (TPR) repeat protein
MKNKYILFMVAGILIVFVAGLIFFSVNRSITSNQLPEIPDLQSANPALKEQILEASKKATKNPSSENIGELGKVYHSGANYEKAEQCYKLAIEKDKDGWIWYYYLGYLKKEMSDSKAAVEYFKKVVEINPAAYHAWFYAGEGFRNLNFNEEAETVFTKVANSHIPNKLKTTSLTRLDFFPLNIYAKYQLARIYLSTKKLDSAAKILKEITDETKSFGPAYRLIGNLYNLKGDSVMSRYYVTRANDLYPYSEPVDTIIDNLVKISRSEVYLLKQIDEAEKSMNVEWTDELVTKALIYLSDNKYLVSKAIKIYLGMDKGEKAFLLADKHLDFYKDDFIEINMVANGFFDKKYYKQALVYVNKAMEMKPEDNFSKSLYARCQWELGEKTEAINTILKLVENEKSNPEVLISGITLLFMFEKNDQAIQYLEILKKLAPQNHDFYRLQGFMAEKKGDENQAETFYINAFKMNPDKMNNVTNLIEILIKNEKWSSALLYLKEALVKHPNEPYVLEKMGTLLVLSNDRKLRNINLGKEFSERAFFHPEAPPATMISAGRSLVIAYASLQDYKSAKFYIGVVLGLAQEANVQKEFIVDLNNLNNQLRGYN